MTEKQVEDIFEFMENQYNNAMQDLWNYVNEQKRLWYENNPGVILTDMKIEKLDGQYCVVFEGLKPRE